MYMDIAVPDDCFALAKKLKQTDKYELAVTGKEPLWVLLYPFRINRPNVHTFSVYKDNHEVVAMFGCCGEKKNPERGTAWWLSSEEPFDSFKFMKNQKRVFQWLASKYKFLWNVATEEQKATLRWVQYMGFKISNRQLLVKNVKMKYFYLEPKGFKGEPIDNVCGPRWITRYQKSADNS
tara:strand:- start:66 stop:602 length:537 start_codon:yes stop_codon:yes gene_type:complete